MLLKIYTTTISEIGKSSHGTEHLHIIDNVEDIVVHQGNWGFPPRKDQELLHIDANLIWGPTVLLDRVDTYDAGWNDTVRLIDYTKNGKRIRAAIKELCYICNDQGKTIEKVEMYSGARLSA